MGIVRCGDVLQPSDGSLFQATDLLRCDCPRHGPGQVVLGDLEDHGSKRTERGFQFYRHEPADFFIILELFKSLVEYFREHRLRLTFIVDATFVFILREVMISLYQHQSPPLLIMALALLALVLGALRTLAIIYSPMERKLVAHIAGQQENCQHSEQQIETSSSVSPARLSVQWNQRRPHCDNPRLCRRLTRVSTGSPAGRNVKRAR